MPQSRPRPAERENRFVIQQHHARSLHWDVRLERDGVLVSFAVPRGLPRDRNRNNLAKHTEDHPLEYLDFHGEIPAGEYGGGRMTIHDRGTYETDKWRDDEIGVTFHGDRTIRAVCLLPDRRQRLDGAPDGPGGAGLGADARAGRHPCSRRRPPACRTDDPDWGYEMSWAGRRTLAFVSGGRVRLQSAEGDDVTSWYPEVRPLGDALAPIEAVLDGEIVAFDGTAPSPDLLARRKPPRDAAAARRAADRTPVQFLAFDLLWLEGHSTAEVVPYAERRELLDGLSVAGDHWQTPPYFPAAASSRWRPRPLRDWPGWSRNAWTRRICPAGAASSGWRSRDPTAIRGFILPPTERSTLNVC